MTLEINPVGVRCNLACTYCYENPMRAVKDEKKYNFEAIERQVRKYNFGSSKDMTVFGGEPLLTPIGELEKIFLLGQELGVKNGIQTNGTLITDRHIDLFKRYSVHIGFSIDGPGRLNLARFSETEEVTEGLTKTALKNVSKCVKEGIGVSLIVTLHKLNFAKESRKILFSWLKRFPVNEVNVHLLENDGADDLVLSQEEQIEGLLELAKLKHPKIQLFEEIKKMIGGDKSNVSCVWNECDPFSTPAVHGINPDGSLSNCPRTNKSGLNYRKADKHGNERQFVLWNTPYKDGGCQGCRFFAICTGWCPGTAIHGDWRNRTVHCETLIALFEHFEMVLGKKVYSNVNLLSDSSISHGDVPHGDSHGDHYDAP